jgi:hypothetical protein
MVNGTDEFFTADGFFNKCAQRFGGKDVIAIEPNPDNTALAL